MNLWGALAGMVAGAGTVLLWVYGPWQIAGMPLNDYLYGIVPGVLVSTFAIWLVTKLTAAPEQAVLTQFEQMLQQLRKLKIIRSGNCGQQLPLLQISTTKFFPHRHQFFATLLPKPQGKDLIFMYFYAARQPILDRDKKSLCL